MSPVEITPDRGSRDGAAFGGRSGLTSRTRALATCSTSLRLATGFKAFGVLAALSLAAAACDDTAATPDAGTILRADPTVESALSAFIEAQRAEARVPALAVAIVKPGRVVWQGAFGLADLDGARAATVDTLFPVGSLATAATAVAVLQQVDAGALRLEDPVGPPLAFALANPHRAAAPVTLVSLLTGTSSILDRPEVLAARTVAGDPPAGIQDLLTAYLVEGGADYAPANFLAAGPGAARTPSRIAVTLAADLVQVATRSSVDGQLARSVFGPLGMTAATFRPGTLPAGARARGYAREGGAFTPIPDLGDPTWPAADLHASVASLARLVAALAGDGTLDGARVLSPDGVARLLTPQVPSLDEGQTAGLLLRDAPWGRVATAGSAGPDHGATLELRLADRVGVVVLTNAPWDDHGAIQSIVARLFEDAPSL